MEMEVITINEKEHTIRYYPIHSGRCNTSEEEAKELERYHRVLNANGGVVFKN